MQPNFPVPPLSFKKVSISVSHEHFWRGKLVEYESPTKQWKDIGKEGEENTVNVMHLGNGVGVRNLNGFYCSCCCSLIIVRIIRKTVRKWGVWKCFVVFYLRLIDLYWWLGLVYLIKEVFYCWFWWFFGGFFISFTPIWLLKQGSGNHHPKYPKYRSNAAKE